MHDRVLTVRAGEKLCALGNEAIARGALEAGVQFVSGYPGTPASEIGDVFSRSHRDVGVHFEWSINEKLGTRLRFETLSALPEGGECCLRRIWEET